MFGTVDTGTPFGSMDLSGINRLKNTGPTGLEPATSYVTGRRSNQLSYDPMTASLNPTDIPAHRGSLMGYHLPACTPESEYSTRI